MSEIHCRACGEVEWHYDKGLCKECLRSSLEVELRKSIWELAKAYEVDPKRLQQCFKVSWPY